MSNYVRAWAAAVLIVVSYHVGVWNGRASPGDHDWHSSTDADRVALVALMALGACAGLLARRPEVSS